MPTGRHNETWESVVERYWRRVQKSDGCWPWTGTRTVAGYGHLRWRKRTIYAHRFSYELAHGPIPRGLEIDHLCCNRACVRPDHLEPVTHRENVMRGHPGAVNAAKTHCPSGHDYVPENIYVYRGRRNCRICSRARNSAYKAGMRSSSS